MARSAFGELLIWGESNFYRYYIKPIEDILHDHRIQEDSAEFHGEDFFFLPKKTYLDHIDKNGKKLFDRAVKKLGVIKADEMQAFEPALALGGEESLSYLAKVNLQVQMKLLKQLTPLHLRNFDDLSKALYGVSYDVNELVNQNAVKQEAVKAGEKCPQQGYWFTVAKDNSRQYFQGDIFPSVKNDWGDVYWQFDGEE